MSSNRLLRTELLLGQDAMNTLSQAKVLIAGLGGVGGHCLDALARSGVKHFILIDFDKFEESNLNRQLLCTKDNIGEYKVVCAMKNVHKIDPSIIVEIFTAFIDKTNIDSFLNLQPTLVVDAIDSIRSKAYLISQCMKNNIALVSSMGAALRTDATKIRIADISKVTTDPLAKALKKELLKYDISTGFDCVYSQEKPQPKSSDELGSIQTVTGSFGLVLAQLAISTILK